MTEHLPILRRVGWLLVVIGLLDIGLMIYCIVNKLSYSSSLNVFALLAGVLLLRGHLGAARYVTWFSAFLLSGLCLSLLVVFPWMQPFDYWMLIARNYPLIPVIYPIVTAAFLWMLFWIYSQLRLPPVIEARVAAGQRSGTPTSAFVSGVTLVVAVGLMLHLTLKGETAQEAKRLAAERYGTDFKYFVSGISWTGKHVSASLTAYKENEVKEVAVEWDQ